MLKIGITGSIGSGKTTVCKILETMGVPVYYADGRGKYLLQNNKDVRSKVIAIFGAEIYGEQNKFNSAALAEIVFKDPSKLSALEAIVHPAVFNDFKEWVLRQKAPYILKEAALLFESGSYKELAKIITVTAPLETRIQRVLERDPTTREQVMARINRQWPDEKKVEMADYIITNDDQQLLIPQILKLHREFGGSI